MGGVNSLSVIEGAMDEGFSFVQLGIIYIYIYEFNLFYYVIFFKLIYINLFIIYKYLGRGLIREPDFVLRIEKEYLIDKLPLKDENYDCINKCITCNLCITNSVNPNINYNCPFRNLEEKVGSTLINLKDNNSNNNILNINQTNSKLILPDIEDGYYLKKSNL